MDVNSSYRLAMRVGDYVKFNDDGSRGYCNACNIPKIFDRDSTNWNDLLLDIGAEIKLGHKHKLCVTFWNKMSRVYEEITSDQKLLDAIDMYWDVRRLSFQVCVMRKDEFDSVHDIERQQSLPCLLQSLDIWRKLAMNMFMILTHHHLLFQSQRERESRKKSLTTYLHPQFATPPRPITSMQTTSPMTRRYKYNGYILG